VLQEKKKKKKAIAFFFFFFVLWNCCSAATSSKLRRGSELNKLRAPELVAASSKLRVELRCQRSSTPNSELGAVLQA